MSLKHYLRGLGIGILVTAVVLGFTGKTEKMTDAQIKIKAAQLGMVEEKLLSDLTSDEEVSEESKNSIDSSEAESESVNESTEAARESTEKETEEEAIGKTIEETEAPVGTSSEVSEEGQEAESVASSHESTEVSENTNRIDEAASSEPVPGPAEGIVTREENYVIFTVESGETSSSITQKLHTAGLIDSAEDYNRYLMEQGYSRQLKSGTHRIPAGASNEEIAKILCRLN